MNDFCEKKLGSYSPIFLLLTLLLVRPCWGDQSYGCTSNVAIELSQCLSGKEASVNVELDAAMKHAELIARDRFKLVNANEALLLESQARWRDYVSAQCKLIGALEGNGLYRNIIEISCRIKYSVDRKEFLEKIPYGG